MKVIDSRAGLPFLSFLRNIVIWKFLYFYNEACNAIEINNIYCSRIF